MAQKNKVWDAKTHEKVQSLCTLLNMEMKNLNKALNTFTKEAGEQGYKVEINGRGEVVAKWEGNKVIKMNPD